MSSGQTRQYSPDQVVGVHGTRAISGLMKGTWVEADRKEDSADTDAGSDGEVTLIRKLVRTGTVKYTLQQSSPLNDYFSALMLALESGDMTTAVQPHTLKDNLGTTLVQAKQSWIKKPAKVVYSDAGEGREWTIETGYLDIRPGGANVL